MKFVLQLLPSQIIIPKLLHTASDMNSDEASFAKDLKLNLQKIKIYKKIAGSNAAHLLCRQRIRSSRPSSATERVGGQH